ncbi:MAG TPA: phage tail protein [Methylibium sp.]|nr:phage tail protein [Methylibium sp.]
MARQVPYGAFNFLVNFAGSEAFGGFSDVSGLGSEITVAEYRYGNDRENHVRKVPGVHKVADVTLKRGVIDSSSVWQWITETRTTGVLAQKDVSITLLDEARNPVQTWKLRNVIPMKYTGPTLAAKGGGDVAMEELVLSAEGLEVEAA